MDIVDGITSEADKYTVTYTLTELGPSADYEATLLAHNDHGWSKMAPIRSFHINGGTFKFEFKYKISKCSMLMIH